MNFFEPGDYVLFEPKKEISQIYRMHFPVKCQVNTVNHFANSSRVGLTAFLPSGSCIRFTAFAHQLRPLPEESTTEISEMESDPPRLRTQCSD